MPPESEIEKIYSQLIKEKEEKREAELRVAYLSLGGQSVGTLPYVLHMISKCGMSVETTGVVDAGDAIGFIGVLDGDINIVKWARDQGIPSRHVYWPAARKSRESYQMVRETVAKEGDPLERVINEWRLNDFSLLLPIFAISGIGNVIAKRLTDLYKPAKPNVGMIKMGMFPSVFEPGAEDSQKWFLENLNADTTAKKLLMHVDMANIVWEFLKRPGMVNTLIVKKKRISSADDIRKEVKELNFYSIDSIVGLLFFTLFCGLMKRDLRLIGRDNVKTLDSWDVYNRLIDGDVAGISIFPVRALEYKDLHDVVFAGLLIPVPRDSLLSYSIIVPPIDLGLLFRGEKAPNSIVVSNLLAEYGVGIAFVKLDLELFTGWFAENFLNR